MRKIPLFLTKDFVFEFENEKKILMRNTFSFNESYTAQIWINRDLTMGTGDRTKKWGGGVGGAGVRIGQCPLTDVPISHCVILQNWQRWKSLSSPNWKKKKLTLIYMHGSLKGFCFEWGVKVISFLSCTKRKFESPTSPTICIFCAFASILHLYFLTLHLSKYWRLQFLFFFLRLSN